MQNKGEYSNGEPGILHEFRKGLGKEEEAKGDNIDDNEMNVVGE